VRACVCVCVCVCVCLCVCWGEGGERGMRADVLVALSERVRVRLQGCGAVPVKRPRRAQGGVGASLAGRR
jgi:hypothetical protein